MNNMKNILIVAFALVAVGHAGAKTDSLYTVEGILGGGYVYNMSVFPYGVDGLSRNGLNGYARMMWSPEHMLDVGLEIGYTNLYRIDPAASTAVEYSSLNAYPLFLVFSMHPMDNFGVSAGFGTAILSSVVDDRESVTAVTTASTAVFLALEYMWPVADRVRIGGEARFSSYDRFRDKNFSLNLVLAYSLIRY
ncbi:MAG: hypothetical protein IPH85_07335 [Ignavibacteria bacterium]|nr:hypothetical protein [Ignavibacteria bacterium]MBK7185731.1 hypothetical protein [Ignavibacteria bacterium]